MKVTIKSFLILSLEGFELLSQVQFNILKFEHTAEPHFGEILAWVKVCPISTLVSYELKCLWEKFLL